METRLTRLSLAMIVLLGTAVLLSAISFRADARLRKDKKEQPATAAVPAKDSTAATPVATPASTQAVTPAAAPAAPPSPGTAAAAASIAPHSNVPSDSTRAAIRADIDRTLRAMADTLKLTLEQKTKAKSILTEHAYNLTSLRDRYRSQEKTPQVVGAMRTEMQQMRESTDMKLGSVFTVDQMNQYRAKRDEWLGGMRTRLGLSPTGANLAGTVPATTPAGATALAVPPPAGKVTVAVVDTAKAVQQNSPAPADSTTQKP